MLRKRAERPIWQMATHERAENWAPLCASVGPATLLQTVTERAAWLSGIRSKARLQDIENCVSAAAAIHPARVISELRRVFPRDGVLVVNSGAHRAFAGHYREAYEPRTYISATNLGPMGWAIAAASGVQRNVSTTLRQPAFEFKLGFPAFGLAG